MTNIDEVLKPIFYFVLKIELTSFLASILMADYAWVFLDGDGVLFRQSERVRIEGYGKLYIF